MCIVQTERTGLSRILSWLRDRYLLWEGLAEPERPAPPLTIIYVVDQSNRWRTHQFLSPNEYGRAFVTADLYPEHEIRDVHVTHNAVHIYLRRKNG